jgi:hypothetical protein
MPVSIGLGIGINARRGGRAYDAEQRALLAIPFVRDWILNGKWDDRIPTSDEWNDYIAWVFDGVWNDDVPTGTPTWSFPDETAFTVWDDSEATV